MSSTIAEFAAVLNLAEKKVDSRPVWLRTEVSSNTKPDRVTNDKPNGNGRTPGKKRS